MSEEIKEYSKTITFNFNEYIKKAMETCQPRCFSEDYLELGLISEIGEIAGKLKRVIRDGDDIDKDDIAKELGDVLWYASVLSFLRGDYIDVALIKDSLFYATTHIKVCGLNSVSDDYISLSDLGSIEEILSSITGLAISLGYTIQEIADINIKKLADRKERNKINGSGDNR